jgi:hypothetical protein
MKVLSIFVKRLCWVFVDIVREKPVGKKGSAHSFHGVVWSPRVKAQVLHTAPLLVSSVRDASALYYLLSGHYVNQLVTNMLPLKQWTDPALDIMLPAYVDLLKNLALQLGASPHLFPLFTLQLGDSVVFPLFSATLETGTSSFAQSDSFIHATCLNLIVGLMQIDHTPIEDWFRSATVEQQLLANHFCELLVRRYHRIANLTTGPVVDSMRSDAILGQISGLKDQIQALNDVFLCSIRCIHVRTCETVLQRFVAVLLQYLLPPLLAVGTSDNDVIPEREALAHCSVLVLSQLFMHVEYDPLLRMLAVAIFHPRSTELWRDLPAKDDYVLTQALNALVQGDSTDSIANPYRAEIMKSLQGVYGEWRVASAALLVEKVIQSAALDTSILSTLGVLSESSVETALGSFLAREHCFLSNVTTMALKCTASLAVQLVRLKSPQCQTNILRLECLQKTLTMTKRYFFRRLLESQQAFGVADIFVDLIEDAIQSRYKRYSTGGLRGYAFMLSQHDSSVYCTGQDVLLRKLCSVGANDVERCRFYAEMAIHFRAVCRVVDRLSGEQEVKLAAVPPVAIRPHLSQVLVDRADDLVLIFSCLQISPASGTDIDLRGRMAFQFSSTVGLKDLAGPRINGVVDARIRSFSEEMIFRPSSFLTLVLDPTNMFVVKSKERSSEKRGTIICCIPLLRVIAAASDGNTLHIAVQHRDVVGLIQNGNMALCFPSAGTSLVVQRYLDRSRQVLRKELLEKVLDLFTEKDTEKDDHCSVEC